MYLAGVYFGYKLLYGSVKTVTKSSVNMARIKVWSLTIFFWLVLHDFLLPSFLWIC